MKITLFYWILPFLLGIIMSWNNIYSLRILAICWGLCVIMFAVSHNKFAYGEHPE